MKKKYANNIIEYLKIIILFTISFLLVGCVGCNDNNKFTEVSSVTFTSGGQTKTIHSSWYIKIGNYEVATKAEYDNAEFKTSVLAPNNVNVYTISNYASECFSGNIYDISVKPYKPRNISNDDTGKYFYIYAHDFGAYITSYYKVEIKGVGTSYVQVKVINNTTIVIKRGSTETTYTVTSYSLKK